MIFDSLSLQKSEYPRMNKFSIYFYFLYQEKIMERILFFSVRKNTMLNFPTGSPKKCRSLSWFFFFPPIQKLSEYKKRKKSKQHESAIISGNNLRKPTEWQ